MEERRHHRLRLHGQHRQGRTSWLAPTVGGLPADSRAAAVLARRRVRQLLAPLARPAARRADAVRAAAGAGAGAGLVQHLPPRAHRGGAAAALRVRRRGRAGRLCARDRRRRAARADRVARPAAARPRDDARAGAAGRVSRCSCTRLRRRRSAAARARAGRAGGPARAGGQRRAERSRWRSALRRQRRLPLSPTHEDARASCRGSPPATAARGDRRLARSAPGHGGSAATTRSRSAAARGQLLPGSSGRPGRSRCWTLWRWRRHLLQPPHRRCRSAASWSAWSPASRWAARTAR